MFFFPIHHTFAPLADTRQCAQALGLLLRPWRWQHGTEVSAFERALEQRFKGDAFLYASGREALFALLKALKIPSGAEIIVQGYTCVVLPNAIHAAGEVPVYVDIDPDTLNMTVEEVARAITTHTAAVICQHTFGIPAPAAALQELCQRHRIPLIEDCAHVFPDGRGPEEIGRHGEFLILSFGRDKAISGITGGAVLSRRPSTSQELRTLQHRLSDLPCHRIGRLLLYPLLYALAHPLYGIGVGKVLLWLCAKIRLLVPILEKEEKAGFLSPLLHHMPEACAALALAQLKRLEHLNNRRRALTAYYLEEGRRRGWPMLQGIRDDLPLQKFPMFVKNADRIRATLKHRNIHLDDGWTGCVICPPSVEPAECDYTPGTDPLAEEAAEKILSLPTHPTMTLRQARYLVHHLDNLLHNADRL